MTVFQITLVIAIILMGSFLESLERKSPPEAFKGLLEAYQNLFQLVNTFLSFSIR
jgi:hypothetical protein